MCSQVLIKQRALKHMADSRGVLLRPQDSNAGGGASSKKILGSGRKRAAGPGATRRANALLGADRGGRDVDPFGKKVKVRVASKQCRRRDEAKGGGGQRSGGDLKYVVLRRSSRGRIGER